MMAEAFKPVRPEMKGEKLNCEGTSKSLIGKECSLATAHCQSLNPFSSLGGKVCDKCGIVDNKF